MDAQEILKRIEFIRKLIAEATAHAEKYHKSHDRKEIRKAWVSYFAAKKINEVLIDHNVPVAQDFKKELAAFENECPFRPQEQ